MDEPAKRRPGRPVSHGMTGSPTYNSWHTFRQACTNPNHHLFRYNGGRGIGYHPAWDDFEQFIADMGEKPDGTSLQRIERDKGYSRDNCFWGARGHETE